MKVLITLITLMLSTVSVHAEDWQTWSQFDHWTVSYNNESCVAVGNFENGDQLGFSLFTQSKLMRISLYNPAWNMPESKERSISMWIDRTQPVSFQAYTHRQAAHALVTMDTDTFNLITKGRVINFVVGRYTQTYRLDGSRRFMTELFQCLSGLLRQTSGQDPFAGSTSSNPFR